MRLTGVALLTISSLTVLCPGLARGRVKRARCPAHPAHLLAAKQYGEAYFYESQLPDGGRGDVYVACAYASRQRYRLTTVEEGFDGDEVQISMAGRKVAWAKNGCDKSATLCVVEQLSRLNIQTGRRLALHADDHPAAKPRGRVARVVVTENGSVAWSFDGAPHLARSKTILAYNWTTRATTVLADSPTIDVLSLGIALPQCAFPDDCGGSQIIYWRDGDRASSAELP